MNSSFSVITVSQLNYYVKSILESDVRLGHVFLRGEVSNFINHRSGHLYMSIKDENAAVRAVMFRANAQRLRFMPADGMRVIAAGRISLYEKDGQYQFYIDDMQPDGVGALYVAYNRLKERLAAEGLFSAERKRPIPQFPEKIGVVTSPDGAAFHDICNVLRRRWPAAEILLYPAEVQGAAAPARIAAGISFFSRARSADVVICGRGGGSLEELWAFNDEGVARAIASSKVPVVSAVGHETDYTIADFAADLRAPTPSAAAELVSPDGAALSEMINAQKDCIRRAAVNKISFERKRLEEIRNSSALKTPLFAVNTLRANLAGAVSRLSSGYQRVCGTKRQMLSAAAHELDNISPLRVLSRGYAAVSGENGIITGVNGLSKGRNVRLDFRDGNALCGVLNIHPRGKGADNEKGNGV